MNIFVTIGTQEPFDRLLQMAESIAEDKSLRITAQNCVSSKFKSETIQLVDFLNPSEYERLFNESDLIIGHAGMGTIITSLVFQKPLIVVPREYKFGEHRNDHQNSTAKFLSKEGLIQIARSKENLIELIQGYQNGTNFFKPTNIGEFAQDSLISSLKKDIDS